VKEVQEIVEEVQRKEVTIGELLTVVAMYPARHHDPYLDSVREALSLIAEQNQGPAQ